MRSILLLISLFLFGIQGNSFAAETIKMSTTTSTRDSGLLDYLLPIFTQDTGITVQVIAKGTGAAIRDGEDGNVDVIFVHDTAREEAFVANGFGTKRYPVMHNDFILVGPAKDPASIKNEKNIIQALEKIAQTQSPFISRGDKSGTHSKELALWKQSAVPLTDKLDTQTQEPAGTWYLSVGQGMGKTLFIAEEKDAYTLSDRGTYIQQRFAKTPPTSLEIIVEGDSNLFNPYGVIPVNPQKFPHVKGEAAKTFAEWLVSPKGQALIADYRIQGQSLFFPDAIPQAK